MLYIGTRGDLPHLDSADLHVEEVEEARTPVLQWFSLPHVHFVGAHTLCSCGFPSVSADVPIEFFPGMFDENPDLAADLRSLEALMALVRERMAEDDEVQLYDVWVGEEGQPPKGTIELTPEDLVAGRFFFNERFLYRVRKVGDAARSRAADGRVPDEDGG